MIYPARSSNRGVTLIELFLVVTLVSILSLVSTAFYSRFLGANAVDVVRDDIVGSLRKAQIYSMMGKQNSVWGVYYNSGTSLLTLFMGNSYALRDAAFDEEFNLNPNVSLSGLSEITFSRITGLPSSQPTINITYGNKSRTVTMNSQGIVNR
ncbi:prepilin-type N-terminal cleavage/methylation domain-containing protein [Candidatus Gottesmanbacteria bacterium]|nr:prepilin-type N-terminal cleavage/methylation domain-containing protein [Candidatus Gottesmanbacteria bacterium]